MRVKNILSVIFFMLMASISSVFAQQLVPEIAQEPAQSLAPETVIEQAKKAEPKWRSYTSLTNASKYGDNFSHYDYVNVNAKKGGTLDVSASGTFNSFNPYIAMGVPAAGTQSRIAGLQFEPLMGRSMDESSVVRPQIAEMLQYPDDFSWVKYKLNSKAKWHDGKPITPEDVIFSFDALKENSPFFNNYYHAVEKAEVTGAHEVMFTFEAAGNRELPHIMADLPILPKHWWQGVDKNGKQRDISKPTLEVPLSSAPYKIVDFEVGKSVTWQRVEDYWGKDLALNIGRNNFDTIKYTYFIDNNAMFEAFKKGGISDFNIEPSISRWHKGYDFPAVKDGKVIKESFVREGSGVMQGFFINTRRKKFQDIRVRKALTLAYDFETLNKSQFFNEYKRIYSYFQGLDFASKDLPKGQELEILQTLRGKVPAEVFTEVYTLPNYDEKNAVRTYLTQAMQLLNQAGWYLAGNRLVNDKNEQLEIEILLASPVSERSTAGYIANLKRLGINATMRVVDSAQYQNRVIDFDFDMIISGIAQSDSPGNEQIEFWGSQAAERAGSYNYSGIKNEAIDILINRILYAKDRAELEATVAALDRVLLWNYYVVPQYYMDKINIAYWNKFAIPRPQPAALGVDVYSWWVK